MLIYPSFRPEQYEEYNKAFLRMMKEFGEKRTNEALTRAIDAVPSFPPTPAEIRRYVQPERVVTCGSCENGWVRGFVNRAGEPAVKRCGCVQ